MIRQPEREQPNRLTGKTLDQVFIMRVKEGLGCSQFEAEALTSLGAVPPRQQNSRPPTGIAPRLRVGCQSSTLPSSANYNWDKGCDVHSDLRCYHTTD